MPLVWTTLGSQKDFRQGRQPAGHECMASQQHLALRTRLLAQVRLYVARAMPARSSGRGIAVNLAIAACKALPIGV